jgi:hypothetical protein
MSHVASATTPSTDPFDTLIRNRKPLSISMIV